MTDEQAKRLIAAIGGLDTSVAIVGLLIVAALIYNGCGK